MGRSLGLTGARKYLQPHNGSMISEAEAWRPRPNAHVDVRSGHRGSVVRVSSGE